jgi:hypothetical protein
MRARRVVGVAAAATVLLVTACGGAGSDVPPPATPTAPAIFGGTPFTLPDGTRCVRFDGGGGQCEFSSPTP